MGLFEEEIKELRQRIVDFDAGRIDGDRVKTLVSLYGQVLKRANLIFSAEALALKYKKGHFNSTMIKRNLLGDGTVIDLETIDREAEKVKCSSQEDRVITRAECLDYSGSKENVEGCSGCGIGKTTKRLLLKDNAYPIGQVV